MCDVGVTAWRMAFGLLQSQTDMSSPARGVATDRSFVLVLICWRARISNGRSVNNSDPLTPTFHIPAGDDALHFSLPGPGPPQDLRLAGTSQNLKCFFRVILFLARLQTAKYCIESYRRDRGLRTSSCSLM